MSAILPSFEPPPGAGTDDETGADADRDGRGLALAFWFGLVLSAGLFAAATLAPRLVALEHLEREVLRHRAEVDRLGRVLAQLDETARLLQSDPGRLAGLARTELGAGDSAWKDVPVEPPPRRPAAAREEQPSATLRTGTLAPVWPWVESLAGNGLLQRRMLLAAATLVLFGFTFLQGRGPCRASRVAGSLRPSLEDRETGANA